MINENKVILMTRLASYEANEGKKDLTVCKYFRSDYIGIQVMKAIFSGTIVFCMVVGLILLYNFDTFMNDLYKIDLVQLGKDLIIRYVVCVGIYTLIIYIVSAYKYYRARQGLKAYYSGLRKVARYYE